MNGAGSCYDNAPTGSFFSTLKSKLVHHSVYHTRDEAKADVFCYIVAITRRWTISARRSRSSSFIKEY
jgi:hypothetical protein